jgi:Helix-turn-helix domain
MQVTIAEAAEKLRLSEHTVRRRVKSGELPSSQVATPQGFVWMVELPDDSPDGNSDATGEIKALRELIDQMASQIAVLTGQLQVKDSQMESKDRQISELHVLLQQAQAALPAPRDRRPWWSRLLRRG